MSETYVDGMPTTEPFRVGAALSKTFAVFTGKLGNFLLLTLVPMIPVLALTLLAQTGAQGRPLNPGAVGWAAIIGGILTFVLQIVAQATTLYGAFQLMRGESFTIGQSLQVGLRRALPVVAVAVCSALAAGLAAILLVIPGLIVFCMLYVAVPVCVIERLGVFASLSRSAALTKGNRWQIFGLILLVAVISGVMQFVLSLFGRLGITAALIQFAWTMIATCFGAVLAAVVYHDLRVAKEGIDIDNLAHIFD